MAQLLSATQHSARPPVAQDEAAPQCVAYGEVAPRYEARDQAASQVAVWCEEVWDRAALQLVVQDEVVLRYEVRD